MQLSGALHWFEASETNEVSHTTFDVVLTVRSCEHLVLKEDLIKSEWKNG